MEQRDRSPLPPDAPPRSSFPQNPEEFDADPRVSFSKVDHKFILEADDGQEYEFDEALKRWVPLVRPARHPPLSSLGDEKPIPAGSLPLYGFPLIMRRCALGREYCVTT